MGDFRCETLPRSGAFPRAKTTAIATFLVRLKVLAILKTIQLACLPDNSRMATSYMHFEQPTAYTFLSLCDWMVVITWSSAYGNL